MITSLYQLYTQYPNISTDTRNITPDSIFFCLKGENFDGNQFAKQALESGAVHVISDDPKNENLPHVTLVEDVLTALQQLSLYHRQQITIPVIGITGTNGKTTTKELVTAVLAEKYNVACTKGNLNNHIGVPLTLLSIRPENEIAVVEMGANHPGEIEELCRLVLPTAGIVTNIGKAHIEGFGSLENILHTKTALYRSVMERKGTIFINMDDALLAPFRSYENYRAYSQNTECEVCGKVVSQNPCLTVEISGEPIATNLTGIYNIYNILCAVAIGNFFHVPPKAIRNALQNYKPNNHRSQVIRKGDTTLIADFYNANPASMEVALENLASLEAGKKIAILGDMLELGKSSRNEHRQIIALCEQLSLPAFFIGDEFKKCSTESNVFQNVREFNDHTDFTQFENSTILVKGSRGIKLEQTSVVKYFSDEKK